MSTCSFHAGQIVAKMGFLALNISVAVLSILYVPMLYLLKDMHDYQPYEGEDPNVVMKDPPPGDFQTIALQESSAANGYQDQGFQETNFANFEGNNPQPEAHQPSAASNPFKNNPSQNNPFRN